MTLYTDYDPWCCARLMSRVQTGDLPDGDVMLADVRELTEEHLAKYRHIHLFAGIGGIPLGLAWAGWPAEWSIITGGFPCPDISTAGKRAGLAGKRSGLFFDMLRICEAVRPDWILAENVGGLASCGLDTVAGSLEQAGYHVWPLRVGAWSLGAPHERERWWVVCGRRGVLADADVRRYDGWAREPWRAPLGRTASGQVRAYSPTPVAKDADSQPDADGARCTQARTGHEINGRGEPQPKYRSQPHADSGGRRADRRQPGSGADADKPGPTIVYTGRAGCEKHHATTIGGDMGHAARRPDPTLERGWPVPVLPGFTQREWEFPRLHQRGLGCAVHGLPGRLARSYNRSGVMACGNAVVPQVVAAIARGMIQATGKPYRQALQVRKDQTN